MKINYLLLLIVPLTVLCTIESKKKLIDQSILLKIREIGDRTHMMSRAISKNAYPISKLIDRLSSRILEQFNNIKYDTLENRNNVFEILDDFLKLAKEDRHSRGPPQISEMRAELRLVQNEVKLMRSELDGLWRF